MGRGTAGYSKRPLAAKLGLKAGHKALVVNPPADYREKLNPLPANITFVEQAQDPIDFIHPCLR